MSEAPEKLRLDKWLWAARFFKTRALAADAIDGGKVRLNGHAAKPAKEVKPGDVLDLTLGEAQWTVLVRGINAYRRPAPEAQALYEETGESRAKRVRAAEARALAPAPGADLKGRPTKRDRRRIARFSG
ncbi:MAG: RNA-binding S4 domain-containing protein [Rhodocyclaceae bacterium]|nr:RNA-binding S4 domain-containing protein [Rhodocyclaceae bacterium]